MLYAPSVSQSNEFLLPILLGCNTSAEVAHAANSIVEVSLHHITHLHHVNETVDDDVSHEDVSEPWVLNVFVQNDTRLYDAILRQKCSIFVSSSLRVYEHQDIVEYEAEEEEDDELYDDGISSCLSNIAYNLYKHSLDLVLTMLEKYRVKQVILTGYGLGGHVVQLLPLHLHKSDVVVHKIVGVNCHAVGDERYYDLLYSLSTINILNDIYFTAHTQESSSGALSFPKNFAIMRLYDLEVCQTKVRLY